MKFRHLLFAALLAGCGTGGGGGNGGGFVGAARISLTVSPGTIDTHDRARVTIDIQDVIDTGIILKVRFPDKLQYAVNTARLRIESDDDEGRDLTPAFNGQNDDTTYLVFFLPRSMFGDVSDTPDEDTSEPATLTFELIGQDKLKESSVEADADVNDPTIDDSTEFDVNDPAFDAETEGSIAVQEARS